MSRSDDLGSFAPTGLEFQLGKTSGEAKVQSVPPKHDPVFSRSLESLCVPIFSILIMIRLPTRNQKWHRCFSRLLSITLWCWSFQYLHASTYGWFQSQTVFWSAMAVQEGTNSPTLGIQQQLVTRGVLRTLALHCANRFSFNLAKLKFALQSQCTMKMKVI